MKEDDSSTPNRAGRSLTRLTAVPGRNRKRGVRVDPSAYVAAHRKRPRGKDTWLFQSEDGTQDVEVSGGSYSEARAALPAGRWKLLP